MKISFILIVALVLMTCFPAYSQDKLLERNDNLLSNGRS